jgi:hypothetical protein
MVEKAEYFRLLSASNLPITTINNIHELLKKTGFQVNEVPPNTLQKTSGREKITEYLSRLDISVVLGNPSWEGLLIGFPGDVDTLSTKSVGTPYLRIILYPILDLHHRLEHAFPGKKFPCIYFVGERFSDVFLRKFDLLREVVPNIIVLTHDIYECAKNKSKPPRTEKTQENESWTQMKLCQQMNVEEGLSVPTESGRINLGFLSSEVPCNEGTENPERLDILGYDKKDHSLVAFELKGQGVGRLELENLFLQGLEHRNWIEKNKMAIKLMFDSGPRGKRINTRKRVRLFLGFYGDSVPEIFYELREEAKRRDKYTQIDFIKLHNNNDRVEVAVFAS